MADTINNSATVASGHSSTAEPATTAPPAFETSHSEEPEDEELEAELDSTYEGSVRPSYVEAPLEMETTMLTLISVKPVPLTLLYIAAMSTMVAGIRQSAKPHLSTLFLPVNNTNRIGMSLTAR